MHNVTQNFLNTIKLPNRGFKSTVKIRDIIFDNTNIIEMSLEENVNPANSFMLGSVASNKLEVTLIDVPNILILENAIVNPNLSLLVGSNYEEVPLGVFTVDEISKDKSIVKLICYDNMIKLEKTYFSNLSYPASINSVAQEICSKAGVQLATTLPSALINKIEGYTYREAISFIASFLGGFARFNRIGKLEIVSYGTTNVEVTGDNYFKLNTSEKAFTIGRLACQVGENIISVGASGNEIKFENPIMTQVQLNNIFNTLKVLSYMPYSMDWQGNPALMAGDKIKIIDVKGNTYNTLLMQQKLSYKGGLSSISKAVGKTEQAQEFSSSGGIKNKVERVVIEQANIKLALIEKATIEDLTVVNARVDNLYTTDLIAVNAKITNLEVHKADVIKLNAETARINDLYATKATIVDLIAERGKITLLETKVGSIDTILSKEVFAELISAGKIVAGSSIIAEGAIGSAQISSLSATKLSAGIIDATVITVKNLNADNITVGSINGKRIAEGAIDNSKVAAGANISGSKLNINDVIVNINGSTTQINGTKIQVGDRTLDLELSTQKIVLEENKTTISKQQATINAMDNAIKLKVDNQTFNTFKSTTDGNIVTVTTNLNKATSSIDVLQKSIALKVSQTDIDNSINSIEIGGRNLLLNSSFAELYRPDLVTNKHESLYAAGYGGYNSGIKDPTTSYHAHLNIDTFKLPVCEFNESDGSRNWKGFAPIPYNLSKPGEYVISFDLYAKGVGTKIFGGFYYTKSGETTQGFHSGQYNITDIKINQWGNYSAAINLNADVDFTKSIVFYFYGYGFTSNSILYMKNPKLEKGNKATDWTPAPEDTDKAISTVDTKINTKVGEINVTLDGVTSRVGKTESATTTIDGKVTALSTRVSNAEQKITPDGIVGTVRSSTAYKTDMNGKASQSSLITTESKVTQLAGLISQRVESKDFATYRTQTDKLIAARVATGDFLSYKTQIAKEIAQGVSKGEFGSLFKQNIDGFNFGFNSGQNLLYDSGGNMSTPNYNIWSWNISKKITPGTTVTVALKGTLGTTRTCFGIYNSGGMVKLVDLMPANKNKDGIYTMTFQWPERAKQDNLNLYHMPQEATSISYINWVTLVEGNVPAVWSAPTDFNNTSVTITDRDGLVVRNNALSVVSKSGRTAFKVDDEGYIYNEWGVSSRVKPGGTISVQGKMMADDKCSTLLRAFGIWHESIDSKYNMRIGSKSEIWFKNLADEFQDIRTRLTMANQFRTTYNNDAGVIIRENTVDSGTGRLWLNWGGGKPGSISQVLIGDGMIAGSYGELHCGSLYTHGTKNRAVETEHFGTRALGAYELPTPYFGDISRQVFEIIDGQCIVPIDPIFKETITSTGEYQVFITKYGPGDIWVAEMHPDFFIVKGANIKFSWELKAIQKGYENNRLEQVQI